MPNIVLSCEIRVVVELVFVEFYAAILAAQFAVDELANGEGSFAVVCLYCVMASVNCKHNLCRPCYPVGPSVFVLFVY